MGKEQRQSRRVKPRASRDHRMELKHPLAERVAAYALAAAAAGLGVMAGAPPAEAQIVYTPANIHFFLNEVDLDLNNDGIDDFSIHQFWSSDGFGFVSFALLEATGRPGNGVIPAGSSINCSRVCAARLVPDAKMGPGEDFYRGGNVAMAGSYRRHVTYSWGAWQGGTFGFLGLEFQIDGQAHYGWAAIIITSPFHAGLFAGVIKGYAYNTVPNQPIRAGQKSNTDVIGEILPQPATLGLLALGAPGLEIWRRRRRASS